MPLQDILDVEFQSKAPASLLAFLVFFTANGARCALAAMNVVSLLRSPFSQTIPEWMWPGTDGWTGAGNERQRHSVLVRPQVHCAHDSGNQKTVGRLPRKRNVHPNALSAQYIHSRIASREAELRAFPLTRKLIKKERT
jgi:hypothetical protein